MRLGPEALTVAAANEREERGGAVNEPTDALGKTNDGPQKKGLQ